MSDPAQNKMSELKVSGHTMTLEPGLYCVLNAPEGTAPSSGAGLPAVRISKAPGPSKGLVEIAGLDADGWVGLASGMLVRITGAASNVLVTVYQAKDTKAAAPQLQVLRLSGNPGAGAAPPAPEAPARPQDVPTRPREVNVLAHIYGDGDVGGSIGDWVGKPGSKQWIEGFGISPGIVPLGDIEYQAVLGRGWLSPWAKGSEFCGSRGMSLPLLGLRVRLRGDSAKTHRISLEASFVDGTRAGPVTGAEPCDSPSLAALEAFRVTILPGAEQAAAKARTTAKAAPPPPAPVLKPAAKTAKAPKAARMAKAVPAPAPAAPSKAKAPPPRAAKRR